MTAKIAADRRIDLVNDASIACDAEFEPLILCDWPSLEQGGLVATVSPLLETRLRR